MSTSTDMRAHSALAGRRRALVVRAAALALMSTLALAACGGDDESSDPATAPVTAAPSTATAATATSTTAVGATSAPSDTGDLPPIGTGDLPPIGTGDLPPIGTGDLPPLPPVSSDLPYLLSVTVGIDADPARIERVPLGSTVTITVTNPSAADEFHLHGYDLGDDKVMAAGQPATFTFVADRAGSFELESHDTEDVLMILEVL